MESTALSNGRYIAYYRYLMEQDIGRKLKTNEVVHHINSNHEDNRIENLQLMTRKEHGIFHGKECKGRRRKGENDDTVLALRISDEEKATMEELAKKNKRSLNSEILMAIWNYIKNNEAVKK